MRVRAIELFAVILLATSQLSQGQSLKDSQATLKVGNWIVLRSLDTMTDKVSCTGVYGTNHGIQLSDDGLYVNIKGGIKSVTLRFGENAPRPLRLPQKMETAVDAVILEGSEFADALQSNRLRIQVLTHVRGIATEDLNITGIQAAEDHIKAGCPPTAESSTAPKSQSKQESLCSDQLRARLRAAGVTQKQMVGACRS
jgi:hypothetical protein